MTHLTITICESFENYVEPAIARISYIYPKIDLQYSKNDKAVLIHSLPEDLYFDNFKKDFYNILYRERIYTETLSIRKMIYGAK